LSIPAVAEHVGGVELPDPVALVPALSAVLETVADPRMRCGIRHRLVVLLTVTVCAVAVGARSFVAIAEWVADLPASSADTLGTQQRCPSESTIRRAVRDIDADAFDTVIGGFVQQLCAAVSVPGRRRVLAVDGKMLRGSRHVDRDGMLQPGRHLLSDDRPAQPRRARAGRGCGKTNEITAFTPLLDTLTGINLAGVVITAEPCTPSASTSRSYTPGVRTGCSR
jgi:hypothetical protein